MTETDETAVTAVAPRAGVAVAQFAPGADRDENLAGIRALAALAVERGAGLVVAPEYSSYFAPELGPDWITAAESLDGPFVAGLGAIARDLGVVLVAGLVEQASRSDRFRNTIVAVGPDGAVVAVSRKLHLYDAFGARESDWAEAGDVEPPQLFSFAGLRVGIQTCYDVRFPEVTRRLVDAGADLVLIPAEWVRGPQKERHWRTLVTARAIENTVYVAAADHAPPIGVGCSLIVDPMGVTIASIGEQTDAAVAFPTRARIDDVRAVNPALGLRRFGVAPL
ncbi:carbon-nitrogen hydrolase family protein [Microcella alkalica]|uniref:Putative amidohydrolase n=1 Tax=Microcella alkalica TaxID=355930 RepID=A0A839E8I9_9MICO|nr:carbon-nitrogen hydrolase family protein [Microcella alkalica]MBA8847797.1 putative amidohydrolase [Microcella alkalica]